MNKDHAQVTMPDMCKEHQSLLVRKARYTPNDPWQSLIVASQVALFQAATCDSRTHDKTGGDITRISELGCLACYKPDAFDEIIAAAKSHDLGKIKTLGERWVHEAGNVTDENQSEHNQS